MSGAIPLLPLYAFMAWKGTTLPLPFTTLHVNILPTVIEFSPLYSFLALLNPGTHFSSPPSNILAVWEGTS